MKLASSTGMFLLAAAIALSFLCSFAIIISSVYAHPGSGLSKARDNTCGKGHEEACTQICKFIACPPPI